MKFTRVRINNFYNLKDVDLDFTEGNALIVGQNGSGKSNIIKCIDFLVKRILGRGSTNVQIWDVNAPESFIEVDAVLCKAEIELFSNLRVWYQLCDVCHIIASIITTLKNLVLGHDLARFSEGTLSFLMDKFHHEPIFWDLPEETFRDLFEKGGVGKIIDGKVIFETNPSPELDWRNPCVGPFIQETVDKLFPKLLKITQEAVVSEKSRPKESSDVFMWVRATHPGTWNDLNHSCNIVGDVWLPARLQQEYDAIWTSVREIIGDLPGISFTIEDEDVKTTAENLSLQELIFNLVNSKRFGSPHLYCSKTHVENQKKTGSVRTRLDGYPEDLAEIMRKSPDVLKWLSRCLQRCSEVDEIQSTGKQSFVGKVTKQFLERSLCILPQNRGLLGQGSRVSLDVNKVERMLIQSSLSSDELKQRQYKNVVDAFKTFCGLDIHVREEHFHQTCEQNAQAIRRFEDELLSFHGTSSLDVGKGLSKLGEQIVKQSQHLTSSLQVLVTRTVQNVDSPYSITIQLTDLSGGEMELLMVLCAVHLSGADTVLLDEPGHSLHPPQQVQLRRWLETQRPPDQVCVAISHSSEFISLQTLSCLYHMSSVGRGFTPFRLVIRGQGSRSPCAKTASDEEVVPALGGQEGQVSGTLDGTPAVDSQAQSGRATGALQSSKTTTQQVTFAQEVTTMLMRPTMRRLFFATGLYFVEGETDQRVLTAVQHCMMSEARTVSKEGSILDKLEQARKVMKAREMNQWDILAVGGCGEAVKAYTIARELKIPCAVVLDADVISIKLKKEIQAFNSENWKKSVLYKQISKVKGSLPDAETLLKDIEGVCGLGTQVVRREFQKNGFWIWERDLEEALIHDPAARQKLLEAINPQASKRNVRVKSTPLIIQGSQEDQESSTREELEPAGNKRKATDQPPSTPEAIPNSSKRIKTTNSDVTASIPPQQQASNDTPSKTGHSREASGSTPLTAEQIRKKLHDKVSWNKIPWEILIDVIKICHADKGNPFAYLCKFMRQLQCKGKKKNTQLSQDLLSRILLDDSDDDIV